MTDYAEMTSPTQVEFVRDLPVTPDRVWQYLTDPALRQKWFCSGDWGDVPGAKVTKEFDVRRISQSAARDEGPEFKTMTLIGSVLECDPPHVFAYYWPEENGPGTEVRFTLSETQSGTRLHLVHTKLVDPNFRHSVAVGWHAHLDLLQDLAAEQPIRDFRLIHGTLDAEYKDRI